ncbi:MAG: hypothetical protein JWN44_4648 [Myxococcales bacterium]|nr:hypothetical protein [Myxococcales bacterium]
MSLDAAHRAFEAGDFAEARRLAKVLQGSAGDDATRAAATEILKRTGIDPLIVYLTAGCVLLFVLIVYFGAR